MPAIAASLLAAISVAFRLSPLLAIAASQLASPLSVRYAVICQPLLSTHIISNFSFHKLYYLRFFTHFSPAASPPPLRFAASPPLRFSRFAAPLACPRSGRPASAVRYLPASQLASPYLPQLRHCRRCHCRPWPWASPLAFSLPQPYSHAIATLSPLAIITSHCHIASLLLLPYHIYIIFTWLHAIIIRQFATY